MCFLFFFEISFGHCYCHLDPIDWPTASCRLALSGKIFMGALQCAIASAIERKQSNS